MVHQVLNVYSVDDDDRHYCKAVQLQEPKIPNNCSSVFLEVFFYLSVPPTLERHLQLLVAAGTSCPVLSRLPRHCRILMAASKFEVGRIAERGVSGEVLLSLRSHLDGL